MAALVSEELMEQTWRRMGGISRAEALRLQKACGKEQEELTGFVIGYTASLSPEAVGLALYAHVVIAEAFRRTGAKFRTIKPGKIMRTWAQAKELVASLEPLGRPPADQHAQATSEPAVFRYILGAMDPDQEAPVELTDDEFWHMLCVLKTVSDCLHDAKKDR
jgi:hypothetical protein